MFACVQLRSRSRQLTTTLCVVFSAKKPEQTANKPEKKKKGKELKVLDPKSAQNLCKHVTSPSIDCVLFFTD